MLVIKMNTTNPPRKELTTRLGVTTGLCEMTIIGNLKHFAKAILDFYQSHPR